MAVQDEASFKRYAANGIATVYAIPFLLLNAADLQVVLDDVEVTTGFTVSGVGSNTGSITFDAAPTGDLLLQRVVPFDRLTDYQDNGDLLAKTINLDFDRLWLALQELRRDDSTALRTSSLEPEGIDTLPLVDVRAGRVLSFNLLGQPIVSTLTLEQLEQQPAVAIAAAAAAAASAEDAQESATAASGFAGAASSSATQAEGFSEKAQEWAENPEDDPVEPGLYSAKHWAAKAQDAVTGLDSRVSDLESKRLTRGTSQATTSGTALDFTGIPSGVRRIQIMFNGVSGSGTSNFLMQIGASGGVENSGYSSSASQSGALLTSTAGFLLTQSSAAATTKNGIITLVNISGNTWVAAGSLAHSATDYGSISGGNKTLAGTLDRIRLTTVNGTDTFDAGSINIMYEG